MKRIECCCINVFDVVLDKRLEAWQFFAVAKIKLCKPCIAYALAFGNLVDQAAEGPETVLTGPVWSMSPLIDHVTKLSNAGMIRAENYIDLSSLARGGAVLAPWHGWNEKLPPDVLELVRERQNAIKVGALVIAPSADRPAGE